MKNTTAQGDVTEWQVAAALVRRGKRLLRPLSSATRYDLLIDEEDGTFTRVQCKTGVLRNGCVVFRLYSVSGHDTRSKGYVGLVDAAPPPHFGSRRLATVSGTACVTHERSRSAHRAWMTRATLVRHRKRNQDT